MAQRTPASSSVQAHSRRNGEARVIYFTARHMEPSSSGAHEHIARLMWTNPDTNASGESTRETLVDWIRSGGKAYVSDDTVSAPVFVVDVEPPHLRTAADGRWTDNLLSLPEY